MTTPQKYLEKLESAALAGNLEEVERLTRNVQRGSISKKNIAKIVAAGQTEAAKLIINRGGLCNDNRNKESKILHSAILTGDLELVKLILGTGSWDCSPDKNGIPPVFKIVNISSDNVDYAKFFDCFLDKEKKSERINKLTAKDHNRSFTILHYAAEFGNVKIITFLLSKNCQINAKSSDGSTALHVAVENSHLQVVQKLLDFGAKDSMTNNEKKTPMHLAIETGNFEILKILLDRALRYMSFKKRYFQKEVNRSLVYLATSQGHTNMVALLLSYNAQLNYTSRNTNQTALHLAVESENIKIIQLLIKNEAKLEILDKIGFTPLHVACWKGNVKIVSMLLNAMKSRISVKTDKGLTALHLAVKEGHLQIVSLLLERGAKYDHLDNSGKTPLSYALENTSGDEKILILLLKHIRQVENNENNDSLLEEDHLLIKYHTEARNDKDGNSVLHLAVEKEDQSAINLFLKLEACTDVLNNRGYTPFELATINGSFSVVDIFLNSRPDPKTLFVSRREDGFTPMHFAVKKRNTDMLEVFFKAGVSADLPYKSENSINDSSGLSPLHVAVRKGDKNLIYLLLKNGAKVDVSGRADFETPLFTAAEYGNTEVLEILSEASTTRSSKWEEGYLPMCIAAYRGHERIVRMLLDKGVDPNRLDTYLDPYLTPLHAAAQQGHEKIVRLLLKHGAKVDQKRSFTMNFSTPLLAACSAKQSRIVQLLLEHDADFNKRLLWRYRLVSEESITNPSFLRTKQILTQGNYEDSEIKVKGSLIGYRPIHLAVNVNDKVSIQLLVSSGASVNLKAENGATPIGLAIEKESEAIIKFLLFAGANVFDLHRNKSILEIEVLKTNVKIAEIIVKFMSSSHPDKNSCSVTPLGVAVENQLEGCVEKLLQTGASMRVRHKKESVLNIAVEKRNSRIVKLLLKYGFDANYEGKYSQLALLNAVEKEDANIVKLLLDAGANIEVSKALYKAIAKNNATIVELFLKKGFINLGSEYDSPFRQALEKSSPQVVQKFLDFKASTNLKKEKGDCPIFYAIRGVNLEVILFLLKRGVSVNATTNKGEPILHFAMSKIEFNADLYQILVDYNVNLNACNKQNQSPMIRILKTDIYNRQIRGESTSLSNILLSNGVDPNGLDAKEGKTLLELAVYFQELEEVKSLLFYGANINFLNESNKTPLEEAIDEALEISTKYDLKMASIVDRDNFSKALDKLKYDLYSSEISRSRDIVRQLVQEVARRQAAGEEVNKDNKSAVSLAYTKKYYKKCVAEINLMKVTDICQGISYFNILVAKFNNLADYARNVQVKRVLLSDSEVPKMFPKYGKFLIERIVIGRDRRHFLNSCFPLLKVFLGFDFPLLIVDHIFSFLGNKDLRNLYAASEKL